MLCLLLLARRSAIVFFSVCFIMCVEWLEVVCVLYGEWLVLGLGISIWLGL